MKKLLILGLCVITLISCTQREETTYTAAQSYNSGSSSALVNNKTYISSITSARWSASNSRKFGLSMKIYVDGFERQELAIVKINPSVTNQRVYSNMINIGGDKYQSLNTALCNAMFFLSFYDEAENTYYLQDSAKNILNIESYDATTGAIKGSFDLTFFRVDRTTHQQTQGFGDTLHFTNGKFETVIKQ